MSEVIENNNKGKSSISTKNWLIIGITFAAILLLVLLRLGGQSQNQVVFEKNDKPNKSPNFQAKIDQFKESDSLYGQKPLANNKDDEMGQSIMDLLSPKNESLNTDMIQDILGQNDDAVSGLNENKVYTRADFLADQQKELYKGLSGSNYQVFDHSISMASSAVSNETKSSRKSKGLDKNDGEFVLPMGSVIQIVARSENSNHYIGSPFFGMVSHDVYDFQRQALLINKGATVIGSIQAVLTDNPAIETKLGIVVEKIKRRDGSVIAFDLPASDSGGLGGISGDVNNHSLRKWGGFAAFAVLSAGLSLNDGDNPQAQSSSDAAMDRMKRQISSSSTTAANNFLSIKPTVSLYSGDTLSVMIHDDVFVSSLGDL